MEVCGGACRSSAWMPIRNAYSTDMAAQLVRGAHGGWGREQTRRERAEQPNERPGGPGGVARPAARRRPARPAGPRRSTVQVARDFLTRKDRGVSHGTTEPGIKGGRPVSARLRSAGRPPARRPTAGRKHRETRVRTKDAMMRAAGAHDGRSSEARRAASCDRDDRSGSLFVLAGRSPEASPMMEITGGEAVGRSRLAMVHVGASRCRLVMFRRRRSLWMTCVRIRMVLVERLRNCRFGAGKRFRWSGADRLRWSV